MDFFKEEDFDSHNFNVIQVNGQRIIRRTKESWGPRAAPHVSNEIFIGRIPHNCSTMYLFTLFASVGELYEFRAMMQLSGCNRGYSYALYTNKNDTSAAIRKFNNYEIIKGHRIGVVLSKNNCSVHIVPNNQLFKLEDVIKFIFKCSIGVYNISLKDEEKLEVLVTYGDHRTSAKSRKSMLEKRVIDGQITCVVEWASLHILNNKHEFKFYIDSDRLGEIVARETAQSSELQSQLQQLSINSILNNSVPPSTSGCGNSMNLNGGFNVETQNFENNAAGPSNSNHSIPIFNVSRSLYSNNVIQNPEDNIENSNNILDLGNNIARLSNSNRLISNFNGNISRPLNLNHGNNILRPLNNNICFSNFEDNTARRSNVERHGEDYGRNRSRPSNFNPVVGFRNNVENKPGYPFNENDKFKF